MLVKGKILLAALLAGAANAASIKEIREEVVDVEQVGSRGLQSRYGVQPNYPGAQTYNEAKKNVAPQPTPKPSSYTPPTPDNGTGTTGFRGVVYTDEDGRTYVIRKRNGVENKVYTDSPGWNGGGRQYRQRIGNGGTVRQRTGNGANRWGNGTRRRWNGGAWNGGGARPRWNGGGARPARKKTDAWSPPTPAKDDAWSPPTPAKEDAWSPPTPNPTPWKPDGWNAAYPTTPTYHGLYNPSYKKTPEPTAPEPTMVPTWDNDGHGGHCVEPFYSTCCIQKDYYSFDQKQSLCKKLGCDYLKCDKDLWKDDAWMSGDEPTAVPIWDTDGHDPTAMPTWATDAWNDDVEDDDDECTGAAREACCTQTKGDDLTKSNMCERLKCVWNKCQTEPGWGGDTHPPTNEPTTEPTPKPTRNPTPKPTTRSPTKSPNWGADGYDGDANDNDDWAGDGECTKDEQDRCCSQHETKSLELQAKICKNKFGCTIFKCPQYRTGADGSYAENYDGLDWNDDGHLDDTCTQDEQDKCCEQHDGVSITRQQQICKNMWNCSLLKCPKHRQSYKPKLPTLRPTYRPYASISDSKNYPVNGYPVKEDDGYPVKEDDGYPVKDNGGYSEEDTCSDTDKKSCCNQNPLKPFGVQYSFCTKLGCNLHMCTKYTNGAWKNDAWYEEDAEKCTEEEHFNCCTQPSTIGIGVQHQNCLKTGCSLFNCDEDDDGDEDYRQKIKWGNTEVKFGYGGDDSTCPDEHKWQCCSPNRSISGSYKSIVKNCQNIGCDWDMCPQNRDPELQDTQVYYDSYYEYGNGNYDDKCSDAGKWSCCNPDSTLRGLKSWVKNCEEHSCEWQKCPHHRQGFYDPMEPTLNKDKYEDEDDKYKDDDDEDDDEPYVEVVKQCTDKEQIKCCRQEATLKEAQKNCEADGCDIQVCNTPRTYEDEYKVDHYDDIKKSYDDDDDYKKNDYGGYGGGDDDRPQGNKGPKLYGDDGDNGGYGGDGGDDDRPQGNKGPKLYGDSTNLDFGGGDDRPQGNKGSRNNGGGSSSSGGFMDQGVKEDCKKEFTSGGACREVCTAKVEYKIMGIVMSTHDETTTRPCS